MSRMQVESSWRRLCGAAVVAAGLGLSANSALADSIVVSVDEPTISISPKFYGIFFEEINMAGDGGIYSELIRNRNFEDANNLVEWNVRSVGAATATAAISNDVPTGGFNKQSASFKVSCPEGEDGMGVLYNSGFFGVSLNAGDCYCLQLYVKGDPSVDMLEVYVENEDGIKLTPVKKVPVSTEWTQQHVGFKATKTVHNGRLCIALKKTGSVTVDMVSLMPLDGFGKGGWRKDLGEKLDAISPAFIRFPGGCWVEGNTLATSYRWKQTIGKQSERRTQPNLWGYQVGHGMGYHEYLQLCEDLGAQALFVINCGMSHNGVVPMDKMDEYVQDALDAIEYANGAATTRWGSERVRNGHPEPFNLTMLQVGNENGGPEYNERYALFYDAIKAKYPDIKLVACLWNGKPTSRPIEILDEHYYNSPGFFTSNFHRYDKYDRNGPEIYVGEYAVTQQNGQGALRGALGEAVFMMGMENNADVVTMTSYAPLFVNVNKRGWNPDLINFDNHRSFGTPSYHVQKTFAQNIGTKVVPVKMDTPPIKKSIVMPGGIGVGTWLTKAEFKDAEIIVDGVAQKVDGFDKWRKHRGGEWAYNNGTATQNAEAENVYSWMPAKYKNYTYKVKARKISGREGFLILFNVVDENNFVWWNIGGWGNTRHGLEMIGGAKSDLAPRVDGKIETDKWYDIEVQVQNDKFVCKLDGAVIHEGSFMTETQTMFASATRTDDELILKAVNLSEDARTVDLQLDTDSKVLSKGVSYCMSHPDEWAENSLIEPERVAFREGKFKAAGTMEWTFPGNSVSVLRFKLK